MLPPKGTDPDPCGLFPCKPRVFRGPPEGAVIAIMDPGKPTPVNGARRLMPRCGCTCARREKTLELMCAPKGVGPEAGEAFSLQSSSFSGVPKWGHGCRSWTPAAAGGRFRARARGGGHAPVVAVLLARQADESIAAPKGDGPGPLRAFSLQTTRFRGPPEGAVIAIMDPGKPTPVNGARRLCPRCGSTCARRERAEESIPVPKGHGPPGPQTFSPANRPSLGAVRRGPSSPSWTPCQVDA